MKLFGSPPMQKLQSVASVGACPSSLPRVSSDSLFNRLVRTHDPKASIVPILDKWVDDGKPIRKRDLQWMVKKMRVFNRHSHALQISTWMSDMRYFTLTPGDLADRIDLIAKVQGIEHAERYFGSMSKRLKCYQLYGALLNCYVEERAVGKAEALFQEIKELKLLRPFSYNVLIKLYSLTGQHSKVDAIYQEMKETGIFPDNFTYKVLMDAYSLASNISGIDQLLKRMELSEIAPHWHVYATAAKGYSKAGLISKALSALKKSEILVPQGNGRIAYGFLLTVYADIGTKDDLYRIWNVYKSSEKMTNSMYMCMISSLLKVDDIEGTEEILEEWETVMTFYDFRVPNLVVAAYCKNGLMSKAETLVSKAIANGRTPFANTWSRLAGAYFENGQGPKAVEMMKRALVAAASSGWKPNPENVSASLEYFKRQKDVEAAEEFVNLLRHVWPLTREIYDCLLNIYDLAGKSVAGVLHQMKEEGFNVVEETSSGEVEARRSRSLV